MDSAKSGMRHYKSSSPWTYRATWTRRCTKMTLSTPSSTTFGNTGNTGASGTTLASSSSWGCRIHSTGWSDRILPSALIQGMRLDIFLGVQSESADLVNQARKAFGRLITTQEDSTFILEAFKNLFALNRPLMVQGSRHPERTVDQDLARMLHDAGRHRNYAAA